ncbi:hypothetical protein NQ318_014678 [Aromia moschata]|uniref:Uncharacterized protein n=1 Tax=Aromia moschata TaxID=1265417 RepID=A0AAV8ZAN9_9CUCU|nr:hypothetical protein NQ318_014678 [Aromia moschata]
MGKTKRTKPSQMAVKTPLEQDIQNARFAKPKNRNKIRLRQDEEDQFVSSTLSRKILSAAREQQREMESELGPVSKKINHSETAITKLDIGGDNSDSEIEEDTLEPDTYYENIEINEDDERSMEKFMSKNPLPRRTLADIIMEKNY